MFGLLSAREKLLWNRSVANELSIPLPVIRLLYDYLYPKLCFLVFHYDMSFLCNLWNIFHYSEVLICVYYVNISSAEFHSNSLWIITLTSLLFLFSSTISFESAGSWRDIVCYMELVLWWMMMNIFTSPLRNVENGHKQQIVVKWYSVVSYSKWCITPIKTYLANIPLLCDHISSGKSMIIVNICFLVKLVTSK